MGLFVGTKVKTQTPTPTLNLLEHESITKGAKNKGTIITSVICSMQERLVNIYIYIINEGENMHTFFSCKRD